jgi:hypothetical protein
VAHRHRIRTAGTVSAAVLVVVAVVASGCSGPPASLPNPHRTGSSSRRPSTSAAPSPSTTWTAPTGATAPTSTTTEGTGTGVSSVSTPPAGWSRALTTLPPGGGFTSLSCLSDTLCIAVGGGASGYGAALGDGSGVTESWDGAAWSDPSVYLAAPATGAVTEPILPAVSCTGGPSCVIVDGSGRESTGNGTTWSTPASIGYAAPSAANPADPGSGHPGSRSAAVACPSPTFCAVLDNTGQAAALRNGQWEAGRSLTEPGPAGRPVSLYQSGRIGLACPSIGSCTGVVGSSVVDWNGSSWSLESSPWNASPGVPGQATAIACPSTTLCAIVSGSSLVYRNGVRTWSPAETIDPHGELDSIACPSTTFCMAADTTGSVVTWNGTSWSGPEPVLPAARVYTGIGTSVTCTSSAFCMVIDADGDYATYTGS